MLETKHFLNTLALTFISFSGRFFFGSDPLVIIYLIIIEHLDAPQQVAASA